MTRVPVVCLHTHGPVDRQPSDLCVLVCVHVSHVSRPPRCVCMHVHTRGSFEGVGLPGRSLLISVLRDKGEKTSAREKRRRWKRTATFLLLSFALPLIPYSAHVSSYVPFLLHPPSLFPLTLCSSMVNSMCAY